MALNPRDKAVNDRFEMILQMVHHHTEQLNSLESKCKEISARQCSSDSDDSDDEIDSLFEHQDALLRRVRRLEEMVSKLSGPQGYSNQLTPQEVNANQLAQLIDRFPGSSSHVFTLDLARFLVDKYRIWMTPNHA